MQNSTYVTEKMKITNRLCLTSRLDDEECDGKLETILPLILIFMSQFVLGIGNTLYFSLGQTYLDDNTKKKNTPILMGKYLKYPMFLKFILTNEQRI